MHAEKRAPRDIARLTNCRRRISAHEASHCIGHRRSKDPTQSLPHMVAGGLRGMDWVIAGQCRSNLLSWSCCYCLCVILREKNKSFFGYFQHFFGCPILQWHFLERSCIFFLQIFKTFWIFQSFNADAFMKNENEWGVSGKHKAWRLFLSYLCTWTIQSPPAVAPIMCLQIILPPI